MNKFILPPDDLSGLLGCAFWILLLAGAWALFLAALLGILG